MIFVRNVIGLDIEWDSASYQSKVSTLQLCQRTRCIIIQRPRLYYIPNSLRSLLSSRSITFVGVSITQDIAKLDRDYGLKCWSGTELGPLADRVYRTQCYGRAGLVGLMYRVLGVGIQKPGHVTRSNWGKIFLCNEQIEYATVYASLAIGKELLSGIYK
ncbi:uncharacterized protein LOC113290485 [Papaver somniferum]|uniref:uncharacterized protein LOC113290485 n=1 Tax=Papaver somniferum TaxID=3469 RepID=UPI000E704CE4|nr:uncharacterized protein LOC113290485 [Papaver somniferum]